MIDIAVGIADWIINAWETLSSIFRVAHTIVIKIGKN